MKVIDREDYSAAKFAYIFVTVLCSSLFLSGIVSAALSYYQVIDIAIPVDELLFLSVIMCPPLLGVSMIRSWHDKDRFMVKSMNSDSADRYL